MTKEPNFFEQVQALVKLIPKGRISTYGAIAKSLGAPRSARIVGYALKASADDQSVPAHRVVNKQGLLSGKHQFDGPSEMQRLLELEGIIVEDNQIKNMDSFLWDPFKDL